MLVLSHSQHTPRWKMDAQPGKHQISLSGNSLIKQHQLYVHNFTRTGKVICLIYIHIYICKLLGRLWLQTPDLPNTCPQSCWNSKGLNICFSLASPQAFIQFASLPWVGFFKRFLAYTYTALKPEHSFLFAILLFRFNCWNRYWSEARITRELLSLTNKTFHSSVQTT